MICKYSKLRLHHNFPIVLIDFHEYNVPGFVILNFGCKVRSSLYLFVFKFWKNHFFRFLFCFVGSEIHFHYSMFFFIFGLHEISICSQENYCSFIIVCHSLRNLLYWSFSTDRYCLFLYHWQNTTASREMSSLFNSMSTKGIIDDSWMFELFMLLIIKCWFMSFAANIRDLYALSFLSLWHESSREIYAIPSYYLAHS